MSEIRATTISNAAGTGPITMTGQYAAKAWVNFNGTGTVAIRESGNVGSITDNGTGDYTVTFTTAMVDANYWVGGMADRGVGSGGDSNVNLGTGNSTSYTYLTTDSARVTTGRSNDSLLLDALIVNVAITR